MASTVRWDVVEAVVEGLKAHPDLQGVQVEPGYPGETMGLEVVMVADVTGNLDIPILSAGRKTLDDHFTVPVICGVRTEREGGLVYAGRRCSELAGAVLDWFQANGAVIEEVPEVMSIGDTVDLSTIGPARSDDGFRILSTVTLHVHARIN
jgi:hypothetical protein